MTAAPDPSTRWEALRERVRAVPHNQPAEQEPLLIEMVRLARPFGRDDARLQQSVAWLLHFGEDHTGWDHVEVVSRWWIDLRQDQLGPTGHDLFVLSMLATSLRLQGRDGEAEAVRRRALSLVEDAYGADDARIDGPLFSLAQELSAQHRYAESARLYERLIVLRERDGRERDAAQACHNLAGVYEALGRLDEAESLVRRTLAAEQARTPRSSDIGVSMMTSRLADVVAARDRFDEAISLKAQAMELQRAHWDRLAVEAQTRGDTAYLAMPIMSRPDTWMRRQYADLLHRVGRLSEAEAIYRDLLDCLGQGTELAHFVRQPALARAFHGASRGEERSRLLQALAAVLRDAGRDDEAAGLEAEAVALAASATALRARADRVSAKIWHRKARRWSRLSADDLRRLLGDIG